MKDAATTTERATLPRSRLLPTLFDNLDSFAETPEGVAKLRELTLELAYSGKGAEWQTKSIAEIATTVHPGAACGKQHQVNDGYVHLRTHNVSTDGKLTFDLIVRVDPAKIDEKKAHLRKGDIIFNNTNSQELVGKTCVVDKDYDYAFSNHLTLVRVNNDVEPAFVVGYFRLLLRRGFFFQLCNRWIGQAGINTKVLKEIEVPLPPLSEQRRIVSKVDGLMSLCDELESRGSERVRLRERASRSCLDSLVSSRSRRDLSSAWQRLSDHFEVLYDTPETLAQLRQSILQLAVQGKLVPQDPNDEPAVDLGDPNEELAAQSSFEIPNGWTWNRLSELAEINGGFAFKSTDYTGKGTRVVRISDFDEFGFKEHKVVRHPYTPDLQKFSLAQSNILMAMTGGTVGKSYLVKALPEPMIVNQRVATIKISARANPNYVDIVIRSEMTQKVIRKAKNSTNDNISMGDIKGFAIPVPPLAEQRRIVAKVDDLMALVDALETELATARTTATVLLAAAVAELTCTPSRTPAG